MRLSRTLARALLLATLQPASSHAQQPRDFAAPSAVRDVEAERP